MPLDQPIRRMPLRQLITHAEKSSRTVIEHVLTELLAQLADFRDLSRPVRRRSHYPTMIALQHALKTTLAANQEVQMLANDLFLQLDEIRERAKREKTNRV